MEHFLESWGYLAIFVLSLISSMGIPVGAEASIIYSGFWLAVRSPAGSTLSI
jgi:membrane protein DedA with SNARE-associated domain